jgi:hypothetical protein
MRFLYFLSHASTSSQGPTRSGGGFKISNLGILAKSKEKHFMNKFMKSNFKEAKEVCK